MTDHTHDHPQGISCEDVLKHLVDFLHGEVDDIKTAEIEKHLDSCRGCFSRAEFEKALKARVKNDGAEAAPEGLQNRLNDLMDKF
jgi:anti-sigma factor (TIGR02949 family)